MASLANDILFSIVGELRTILTFRVRADSLVAHLPAGWSLAPHGVGPTTGANLRIAITEQLTVEDHQRKHQPTPHFAPLVVPAIRSGLNSPVAMVIRAYITHASDTVFASPYENGVQAASRVVRSSETDAAGACGCSEEWTFDAVTGDRLTLRLSFKRGAIRRNSVAFNIHSNVRPDFYRIYRIEQGEDLVMSRPSGVDRLLDCTFKATGPGLEAMFDGSEELIAVTSLAWCRREVYLPRQMGT